MIQHKSHSLWAPVWALVASNSPPLLTLGTSYFQRAYPASSLLLFPNMVPLGPFQTMSCLLPICRLTISIIQAVILHLHRKTENRSQSPLSKSEGGALKNGDKLKPVKGSWKEVSQQQKAEKCPVLGELRRCPISRSQS